MAGILYFDKGDFGVPKEIWLDSAFTLVNKAIDLDSTGAYAYRVRSDIYRMPLNQPENAKRDIQEAYELEPNNPDILSAQESSLRKEGKYEEAAKMQFKAIDLGPGRKDYRYYLEWGKIYRYIQEDQNARSFFEQAYKLAPEVPQVLMRVSRNYEKAWEISEDAAWLLWAGEDYLQSGNLDSAEYYFLRVQQAERELEDTAALYPYRPKLAYIYLQQGREIEAQILMDEAINLRIGIMDETRFDFWTRSRAATLIEIAEIKAMQGSIDEAMDLLENPYSWEWTRPVGKLRFLEVNPSFNLLREDQRFKTLVEKTRNNYEAHAEALRKLVREREASEQLKFALDK